MLVMYYSFWNSQFGLPYSGKVQNYKNQDSGKSDGVRSWKQRRRRKTLRLFVKIKKIRETAVRRAEDLRKRVKLKQKCARVKGTKRRKSRDIQESGGGRASKRIKSVKPS